MKDVREPRKSMCLRCHTEKSPVCVTIQEKLKAPVTYCTAFRIKGLRGALK